RHQQVFLAHDHGGGVETGEFESVSMRDGVGRAGFYTVATEDASVVVDVVDLCVTLRGADALLLGVLGGLDIDAVRRARCRAQEACNALLQAVFIALELMLAAEAFLEDRAAQRSLAVGIVFHLGRLEPLTERDAHSLRDGSRITQNHIVSVYVLVPRWFRGGASG